MNTIEVLKQALEDLRDLCDDQREQFDEIAHPIRTLIEQMEKAEPVGWLRAIDEELVCTHLGVANAGDSYEVAKDKLCELINWHTQVATDPKVNGGWKIVNTNMTPAQRELMLRADEFTVDEMWIMLLAAAPEYKHEPT